VATSTSISLSSGTERRRIAAWRRIAVYLEQPAIDDIAAIERLREAIAAIAGVRSDGAPVVPNGWATRYAARRIWHILGHTWEIQVRAAKRQSITDSREGAAGDVGDDFQNLRDLKDGPSRR
jgi:hypothetical protein